MSSKKNKKRRKQQEERRKSVLICKRSQLETHPVSQIEEIQEQAESVIDTEVIEKKKREYIPKKVRFEVFKRDSFKCQYCGRNAPDVVLNIDHIIPVAKGGTSDISNLITSCFDCNSGKSDRQLSDNTIIQKQYNELEKLNERREQLEMMIEWRKNLEGFQNTEIEYFEQNLFEKFNRTLTDTGKKKVLRLIKKYSLNELLTILDILYEKDVKDNIIDTMEKWAHIRYSEKEKPYLKDMFYIRKILDNRFELSVNDKSKLLKVIEDRIINNYNIKWLKECAQDCSSLWQFYKWLEDDE